MANTYSAGIVTAYGAAKKAGYTGTYEEFCAEQASFARNAQQVRQDKESVEQTVTMFSNTTVPVAVQSVTDEGTAQVGLVTNAGTTAVGNVNDAGTTQVGNVNSAGQTQVGNVNDAGTTQVGNVQNEGATQVQAVEDKGAEVIASIPSDYSDLTAEVDDLTRQLSDETTGLDTKAPVILETASGAIASFDDGADNMPVKSLVAQIEPVQDLHGYDSPWPAGGGANKWDEEWELGSINSNGEFYADSSRIRSKNYTAITAETSYYFKSSAGGALFYYDSNKEFISSVTLGSGTVITTPSNAAFFAFYLASSYGTSYKNDTAINYPATVTTYSPYSNICPISGWTGAEISGTGVNVWDEEWENGIYRDGIKADNNNYVRNKNLISARPNTTYYYKTPTNTGRVLFFDVNKTYISTSNAFGNDTFTTPENCYYMAFFTASLTYENNISINYPATDTTYHPYTGNTISINWETEAGTVYGGTVTLNEDGSADLVANRKIVTITSCLSGGTNYSRFVVGPINFVDYSLPILCNKLKRYIGQASSIPINCFNLFDSAGYNNAAVTINLAGAQSSSTEAVRANQAILNEWNESGEPLQVSFGIASPQTYHFDNIGQLKTFLGTNNVWADTGDTEVTYPADTKLYIDNKITQAIANALNS